MKRCFHTTFSRLLLGALFLLPAMRLQAGGMVIYTNVNLTGGAMPTRLKPLPASQTRITEGMLDVTKAPYYADNTGVTNAQPAIQNAIDDAYDANLVVFFPSGTYLCSSNFSLIQAPGGGANSQRKFVNKLVGSTTGSRPVLKLKDGAVVTNNFNAAADYPIFLYFTYAGIDNTGTYGEDPSRHYCAELRGINIDMGNNPGVSAVRMTGAQYCVIEDVDIYGANFAYGLDGIPGGGGSCSNVKITGGQVGVNVQWRPVPLITGLQLYGQSKYGIWARAAPELTVVGFNIVGPATNTPGYVAVYSTIDLTMADGTIQVTNQTSGKGISTTGNDMYLQNVYIQADTCINGAGATTITGSETSWSQISEYEYRGTTSQLMVNGTNMSGIVTLSTVTNVIAPPTNLISQHLWTTNFPSWEDAGRINIINYGAFADNPKTNNAPYIQAALNAAGGTNTVFIPRGIFYVGGQIDVPAGGKIIGASEAISVLQAMTNWVPTTNTSILSTADNLTNGVTLAHFAIVGNEPAAAGSGYPNMTSQSKVTFVTVQTGNTIWRDIQIEQKSGSGSGLYRSSQSRIAFKGNAGGKAYNLTMDNGEGGTYAAGQPPATYHMVSVQNTTNSLAFYEPDTEHMDDSAKFAINNASAVSLFAYKYESSSTGFVQPLLTATNVTNLRVLGGDGAHNQSSNGIIMLSQCAHTRIAILSRTVGPGEIAGLFWLSGLGSTLTDQLDISLFSYDQPTNQQPANFTNLQWDTTIAADSTITDGAGNWTVGGGNWNMGTNSAGVNYSNNANVYIGGGTAGSAGVITVDAGGVSPGNMTFTNANGGAKYTFTGGAITMNGGSISNLSGTGQSISVAVNGSFTVAQTIGNGSLQLQANGTQTSANTITNNSGLVLGNNTGAGSVGSAVIVNNGTLTYSVTTRSMSNAISGSGNLTLAPRATQTLTVLSNLTHAGITTFSEIGTTAGTTTLTMGGANVLSASSDLVITNNLAPTTIVTNLLDMAGSSQTISSLSATGNTTANNCIITNSSGSVTLTLGGPGKATTYNGLLSGSLNLTLNGSGSTLTLGGANTYSGNTTIGAGTLALGTNNLLPSGTTLNLSGGTLAMNSYTNTVNSLQTNGIVRARGTWGALGSSANHNSSSLTGLGILTVTTGGSSGVSTPVSTANPTVYGGGILISVTVTGANGDSTAPTGTVVLYDGVTPIGTNALGNPSGVTATALLTNSTLAIGTHSLTAAYGGNESYDVSTSGVLSQTVLGVPAISSGVLLGGGLFRLNFSGPASQTYKVLGTNLLAAPLTNWPVLKTGTFGVGGPLNTNFTDSITSSQRFYRVVSP